MTLNEVMKDTADAIREKTGKSDLIAPVNFAEEIKGITAGGSGSSDLEGEYFLAKPNGRYWKFTFSPPPSNQYVDPNSLSEEQLEILLDFCAIIGPLSVACGAAVCYGGVASGPELRVDGAGQVAMRMGGLENNIYLLKKGADTVNFQQNLPIIWKECDIKSIPPIEFPYMVGLSLNSYNLVEFLKTIFAMTEGGELTDDEVILILEQMLMLIPATEEEYKAARREN